MKIYKGYQFKSAVTELIMKIAKDVGRNVEVRWSDKISTAGINKHNRLFLADVADDATLSHVDLVKYVGFGVHEILHSKYTDFNYEANNDYTRTLHNAIEDAFIEREGITTAMTGNIGNLLTTLVDGMVTKSIQEVQDWADPRQYPFALAIYLRDHATNKVPLAVGLEPIFDEAKRRLVDCKTSGCTLEIANWVRLQLDQLPETPPQNPQNEASSPDNGEDEGEDEGEVKNGSKPVGNARRPNPNQEARTVEPENEAPKGKAGLGSYSEGSTLVPDHHHKGYSNWMTKDIVVPAKLRYEVKRLFDNSGINDFQRNRKSGAINVHALPSAGYNEKVFKRRHDVEGVDTCVAILLDVSGFLFCDGAYDHSTGQNSRITTAVQTCIALLETLRRAQVATTVLTFGTATAMQKPFEMSTAKAIEMLRCVNDGGSTNDYFAVRYAHKLLLNRPEQRKVCFVLTDGDGDVESCRDQVNVGERLGVTTIGLGIEHHVDHVYPQNASVRDLRELADVSFKQIKLAA